MGISLTGETAPAEQHYAVVDMQKYWGNRRNTLTAQYFEALQNHDREAIADVQLEIQRFNRDAPAAIKLSASTLKSSMKTRRQNAMADTQGRDVNKKWAPAANDVRKLYQTPGE
jgi:hypothetical protein